MPTYVYACTECGHQFEAQQAFTDASLTECPNCAGKLRKVFNSVGIVFKGSGFYRNDSREKAGAANSASGDSGSEKPAEKSAGDKSAGEKSSGEKSSGQSDSGKPAEKPAAKAGASSGSSSTASSSSSSGSSGSAA